MASGKQNAVAARPLVTSHSSLITEFLERETGFEPATSTLARSHSTTELFPLEPLKDHCPSLTLKL